MKSQSPITMSQAQYARHRGVSRQHISQIAKAGVLVMRGRLIDVVASDAVLDDKPAIETTSGGQSPSFADARRVDMVYKAKLRRLEFEAASGKFVEVSKVNAYVSGCIIRARDILLSIGPELRDRLAQCSDPIECGRMVVEEIERALREVAEYRP